LFFGAFLGIAAIILGIVGLKKPGGKGLSIAGIVLGVLGILGAIATALIFIMIALTAKNSVDRSPSHTLKANTSQATSQTSFDKGQTADFGDYTVVASVTQRNLNVPATSIFAPKAGNELVVVSITAQNNGTTTQSVSPLDFKLKTADGVSHGYSLTTPPDPALESVDIAPGAKVTGNLVFEVPKDAQGLQLSHTPFGSDATYLLAL